MVGPEIREEEIGVSSFSGRNGSTWAVLAA